MSWASKEPEKYDELTRKGIMTYLNQIIEYNGYAKTQAIDECFIEAIQLIPELRGLYIELQRLASINIMKAEQEYFGGLVDGAT